MKIHRISSPPGRSEAALEWKTRPSVAAIAYLLSNNTSDSMTWKDNPDITPTMRSEISIPFITFEPPSFPYVRKPALVMPQSAQQLHRQGSAI